MVGSRRRAWNWRANLDTKIRHNHRSIPCIALIAEARLSIYRDFHFSIRFDCPSATVIPTGAWSSPPSICCCYHSFHYSQPPHLLHPHHTTHFDPYRMRQHSNLQNWWHHQQRHPLNQNSMHFSKQESWQLNKREILYWRMRMGWKLWSQKPIREICWRLWMVFVRRCVLLLLLRLVWFNLRWFVCAVNTLRLLCSIYWFLRYREARKEYKYSYTNWVLPCIVLDCDSKLVLVQQQMQLDAKKLSINLMTQFFIIYHNIILSILFYTNINNYHRSIQCDSIKNHRPSKKLSSPHIHYTIF